MSDIKKLSSDMENATEHYRDAMYAILTAMKILAPHDLPGILNAISRSESIAPFIDPTLWRDKHEAMSEDKEVFESALPLWKMARSLMEMKHD